MLLSKVVRFFSENAGPPSPVDGNFNEKWCSGTKREGNHCQDLCFFCFFSKEVRTIHLKMICFTIVFLIIIAMYCMYCAYLCVPYCACLYYLGSQEFLCITKSHQQDPAFKAVAASCDTPTEWPYILMLLARVTHGIMELTLGGGLKDLQWF